MMQKNFWSGIGVGICATMIVGGLFFMIAMRQTVVVGSGGGFASGSVLVQKVNMLYKVLDEAYYDRDELDIEAMQEQALKGFVDAAGDPYTVYLTTEENQIFDEGMQGSQNFEGIGAVVTDAEEGVLIEAVLKGSPAFKAGLQPLDIILQIEGELTKPMGLNDAVQKIRGPKDSEVVVTILREGAEVPIFDVTVTRGTISVPSAEVEIIEQEGKRLVFLTISIFGDDTMRVIRNELRQAGITRNSQIDGMIIDLRGNGGGYLPVAVEVASFFLPKNEIVATARYSIFEDETFKSNGYKEIPKTPVVVLIDGLSASASEIVALALQERGDATLMGSQSFGKGSIQTVQENRDGSSLKLTIGKWYSPSDKNIDEIGVVPDTEVEFDIEAYLEDETDTQRDAAIQLLLGNNE